MRRSRIFALALLASLGVAILTPGRAPATVEEQRRRLPPKAECSDPVTGTWKAHVYYDHVGQWYVFLLDVHRAADGTLEGGMHAEFWNGGPSDASAPPCRAGGRHMSITETATGSFDGATLRFDAQTWAHDQVLCGSAGNYLLDRFSGAIDAEREEFQSVLNADSPEWTNVPTVFRRIACENEPLPLPPPGPVTPPPYQPRTGGCGCG